MSRTLLAHTADLRAELSAADERALYAEAVALVRELLVGASPVEEREVVRLAPGGDDDAERFFRFVRELVYLADAESFLPASVRLEDGIRLGGERFDPSRHVVERQIKAVTRHHFEFRSGAEGVRAELVFDL
ncbi:MAG: archease [Acidobacteria bacterium]|nr:archease [Acidobacteriota bacterium]